MFSDVTQQKPGNQLIRIAEMFKNNSLYSQIS